MKKGTEEGTNVIKHQTKKTSLDGQLAQLDRKSMGISFIGNEI